LSGSVVTTATATTNVGTVDITQGTLTNANNSNYDITFVNGTLTINKKPINITADDKSKTYGDNNPALTYTVTQDLSNLTPLSGSVVTTATATTNVGTVDITQGTLTNANNSNYDITFVNGTLTINKKPINITADDKSKTYGDNNPALTYTVTQDLSNLTPLSGSVVTTATATTNVGTVDITQGTLTNANNSNYDITFVNGTLTINKKPINITADDKSKTYGDNNPALTYTVTQDLSNLTPLSGSVVTTATATTNVGTVDITQGTLTNANNSNYDITFVNGTLTINKKPINITADDKSKTYGDNNPALTYTVTQDLSNLTPLSGSVVTTATATTNVGTVDITQGTLTNANNSNYDITFVNGTLTINKANLTITANNLSKTYGDTLTFDGDEFTSSGLKNSETIGSVTLTASDSGSGSAANAGNYTITPSLAINGTFDTDNYNITYATGTLTVNKADLTVTPVDDAILYGQSDPTFILSYDGFRNGETKDTDGVWSTNTPTITREPGSNSGDYTISYISGLEAGNYNIIANTGTFTIYAADYLLVRLTPVAGDDGLVQYGSSPRIGTAVGDGITHIISAQYLDENNNVVTVSSGNIEISDQQIKIKEGAINAAIFDAIPQTSSSDFSNSNNLKVGGYNFRYDNDSVIFYDNDPEATRNFENLAVRGSYQVTAKPVNSEDITIDNITKTYDNTPNISRVAVNLNSSPFDANDNINLSAVGQFSKVDTDGDGDLNDESDWVHVGTNLAVSVDFILTGDDKDNYALTSSSSTYNVGTIESVKDTVTWVGGATNNLWSDRNNWSNGLVPSINPLTFEQNVDDASISSAYSTQADISSATNILNDGSIEFIGSDDLSFTGIISGTGSLTKSGTGTLTLSRTNTYSGSTTINAGTISISAAAGLGATPGSADADNIVFNGGTLQTTADITLGTNKGITLTGNGTINTDTSTTLTYGGVITGSGNLTKSGTGTLTLSGTNTYTGDTTISAGTINVSGSLSDDTAVTIASGATYNVNTSDTIGSLAGAGDINLSSYTLTIGGDNSSTEVSGVISGTGSLTKSGTGTLTLSGTNTYTGDTTISAGTINVSGSLSDDTAVTVASGATYTLGANDTIASIAGAGDINLSSYTLTIGGDNCFN
jgi:autotransporter-associated beta strand protein